MLRVISQRALNRWQFINQINKQDISISGFISNATSLKQQQQKSLFRTLQLLGKQQTNIRFFTTTTTTATTATATLTKGTQSQSSLWRVFIRPHYYENKPKLSQALKQQQNPFRRFGQRLDNNPNQVLYTVIGINLGVFFFWQYAINCYRQFGDSSWLSFMSANFLNSREAIEQGRYHTLLTSAFSHNRIGHLGLNMMVLYSMGQGAIEAIGASRFLLLYAGAGIMASLFTQAYRKYIRPTLVKKQFFAGSEQFSSLGASGAVMGITTFYACAFPRTTFLLFFIIPMPAIALVGGVAAYDIYQAYTLKNEVVDSAAHIGGATYGAAYWFLRVRPLLKAGRWRL
ncbi:hypothetical protein INT45_011267 [Circinella minor]|uniref:Peptidase S54 rhomboid domain-containing protein n=1 Tax=Circinella minor TaxID=1195481 RepID=A0A8H7RWZ4_9FUNG|nr:hypothetical protein INT45_011267 [Circinella minor]